MMLLESIQELISELCQQPAKQNDFQLRSPFAERYGSWQSTYCRSDVHGTERFVVVDLLDDPEKWLVEINAFAEGQDLRARAATVSLSWNGTDSGDALRVALKKAFLEAAALVPSESRPNLFASSLSMNAGLAH